ncbi:MAG: type II toxin-antitoxin system RelE/ParE family toxin [Bryobacteraceae bacterium]
MRLYVLSREAERDLDVIKAHLLAEAGLRVTRHVIRELREGFRFIAKNAEAGHVREDLTEQAVKFWPVFSYLIVYDLKKRPIDGSLTLALPNLYPERASGYGYHSPETGTSSRAGTVRP